jgi:hypothetical protein
MIIASLLLACSSTGADLTITDLDDPSGHLADSWSVDSALWFWSEGETELWTLSTTTQTLAYLGEIRVDPLSLTTNDSSCEDLQDYLDVGTTLVADLSDGDAVADHCDAIGTYFDDLDALDDNDGTERTTVSAFIEDLVGGTPGTGTWSEPEVTGGLFWSNGAAASPSAGWSAADCTYEDVAAGSESQLWTFPEISLTIDEAESSVVGTLDAELLSDDGGSGFLTAEFDAELCQYTGGAFVIAGI